MTEDGAEAEQEVPVEIVEESASLPADPVAAGIQLAGQRLQRHGLPWPAIEQIQPAIYDAVSALQETRSPDRATELFVESVAIASAVRVQYHEPPLSSEEVRSYLDSSRGFFNSYWHE